MLWFAPPGSLSANPVRFWDARLSQSNANRIILPGQVPSDASGEVEILDAFRAQEKRATAFASEVIESDFENLSGTEVVQQHSGHDDQRRWQREQDTCWDSVHRAD